MNLDCISISEEVYVFWCITGHRKLFENLVYNISVICAECARKHHALFLKRKLTLNIARGNSFWKCITSSTAKLIVQSKRLIFKSAKCNWFLMQSRKLNESKRLLKLHIRDPETVLSSLLTVQWRGILRCTTSLYFPTCLLPCRERPGMWPWQESQHNQTEKSWIIA